MSDTLDQEITISSDANSLEISNKIKLDLLSASKWCKFLAIVGFIGVGFMILGSLGMFYASAAFNGSTQIMVMAFIYLVLGLIFIFPTMNLLRYANHTTKCFGNGSQQDLELAVSNLSGFFKFMGVYIIVMIGVYLLAILAAVIIKS